MLGTGPKRGKWHTHGHMPDGGVGDDARLASFHKKNIFHISGSLHETEG